MKFNTVNEVKAYFEQIECKTMPVRHDHERAVFLIGCAQILMDTIIPYNWFKSTTQWFWTGDGMPKETAEVQAVKYNATVEEAFYSEDENERILLFKDIDGVLQWLFDHRKADLEFDPDNQKANPNKTGTWSVAA